MSKKKEAELEAEVCAPKPDGVYVDGVRVDVPTPETPTKPGATGEEQK